MPHESGRPTPANMPHRSADASTAQSPRITPHPVAPASNDQAGSTGAVVEWWNSIRGFGMVRLNSSNETAFVHISTLPGRGYRCLVEGEKVLVSTEPDPTTGKTRVANLEFPADRQYGTVQEFDHLKGFGYIVDADTGNSSFVHHTEILRPSSTRATLSTGEKVEFEIEPGAKGPVAKRVKRLDPREPLQRFVRMPAASWQDLANLAEGEAWIMNSPDEDDELLDDTEGSGTSPADLPILRSYIQHTFARLLDQGKIAYGETTDGKRAGFNTGLVTQNQEEIYGILAEKSDEDGYPWRHQGWMKESDGRLAGLFSPRPARATYWSDPSVLFYDPRLPLILDWDHFVKDNISRYPSDLRDQAMALMLTRSAIDRAVERVARNYKAAVPQFHRGEVQLLLPLALRGTAEAQLALVVRRVGDEYHGETVLALAAALKNARLLARPDRDWLNP
ncbi:DUF3825 domain-containing protein [Streptomyces sp. NPDC048057]|uniref:DUF3825 domain-containing protein n=1 Tax=Streptomyces sp. NPDC048057 TaxID=3155628 RepID=UPI003405DB71